MGALRGANAAYAGLYPDDLRGQTSCPPYYYLEWCMERTLHSSSSSQRPIRPVEREPFFLPTRQFGVEFTEDN